MMKDAVSRRSRGFGFITYMNSASVDAALSVKQHIVDNRRVEAKRAVPRSEVPTKVCVSVFFSRFVEIRFALCHTLCCGMRRSQKNVLLHTYFLGVILVPTLP